MLPLAARYSIELVALSLAISVLASGAALDLAGRVTAAEGRARLLWLAGGGTVMGLGIWAMHYTGMLAFELPVPVFYHVPTVALSLVAAVLASLAALYVASRDRLSLPGTLLGSLIMGTGIASMHYIGMDAMRLAARMEWHAGLVAASLVVALAVSAVALRLAFRYGHNSTDDWTWYKVGAAVVMGLAVCSMHYTGMAAARFLPDPTPPDLTGAVSSADLGANAVTTITALVLVVAIGVSVLDRRLMSQALQLQAALAEVKTLRGLFPICAECKRVRTDDGAWQQLEAYVKLHTEAQFSHGFCPDCERRWMQSHLA